MKRKNGRPISAKTAEMMSYGLTFRQARDIRLSWWENCPELGRKVIANELIRQREARA